MCGRFTLANPDGNRLRLRFDLSESIEIDERPRFNIAPTDEILAVRMGEEDRDLGRLRWGLLPGRWAQQRKGQPLINARAETISTQPAFAESFRARRCLIPADGFYEWRTDSEGKQPIWISRADQEPFAFAGIWAKLDPAEEGGEPIYSTAIATCQPNSVMRPIHDRMPVILAPDREAAWIDPEAEPDDLLEMLTPADDELLTTREVGDAVNSVRNDGPELLEPPMRLF